jgi:hypothetical protein
MNLFLVLVMSILHDTLTVWSDGPTTVSDFLWLSSTFKEQTSVGSPFIPLSGEPKSELYLYYHVFSLPRTFKIYDSLMFVW